MPPLSTRKGAALRSVGRRRTHQQCHCTSPTLPAVDTFDRNFMSSTTHLATSKVNCQTPHIKHETPLPFLSVAFAQFSWQSSCTVLLNDYAGVVELKHTFREQELNAPVSYLWLSCFRCKIFHAQATYFYIYFQILLLTLSRQIFLNPYFLPSLPTNPSSFCWPCRRYANLLAP